MTLEELLLRNYAETTIGNYLTSMRRLVEVKKRVGTRTAPGFHAHFL